MREVDWRKAVERAEHYKALGQTDIYIGGLDADVDLPWEWVDEISHGGSHRLDLDTSITFRANHPSGLTFSWFVDLEERDANGRGYYMLSRRNISIALTKLTGKALSDYRAYLNDCARAMRANADKILESAGREYADAALLEQFKTDAALLSDGQLSK